MGPRALKRKQVSQLLSGEWGRGGEGNGNTTLIGFIVMSFSIQSNNFIQGPSVELTNGAVITEVLE